MRYTALSFVSFTLLFACGGSTTDTANDGAAGTGAAGTSSAAGGSSSATGGSSGKGGSGTAGSGTAGSGGSGTGGTGNAGAGGSGGGQVPSNVQATQHIFFGDTDWNGTPNNNAWILYGMDLDGHVDTPQKTAVHCDPVSGAKGADVMTNGPKGEDNSFGMNIWPMWLGLASDAGMKIDGAIADGTQSWVVGVDGLPASGDGAALNAWFSGVRMQGTTPPTAADWMNGTYGWSVNTDDLVTPTPLVAKAAFPGSVLSKLVLSTPAVSSTTLTMQLGFGPGVLHFARVQVTYSPDETSAAVIVAGVLDTQEYVAGFKKWAGTISSSLCSGSALDGIAQQLAQASDMNKDGTQKPGTTCDGISVGVGLKTRRALIGGSYTPPAPANPCP